MFRVCVISLLLWPIQNSSLYNTTTTTTNNNNNDIYYAEAAEALTYTCRQT